MKKNLLLFSLIFAMCTAFGQEVQTENNAEVASEAYETSTFCPHHINIHVGEAWTNNIYKRVGITQYYSHSTMLDIDYAYFFNEHWGLSLGVGLNRLAAKASISKSGVIPDYDVLYDDEVLQGMLPSYDWLHLHHEDFTGQYGKYWARYHNYPWYQEDVKLQQATAERWGFSKVSQLKLAVAKKIREFVAGGGYMFAMCSAPDSYDIALAAEGLDICDYMFDGDPIHPGDPQRLNYDNCFAFTDFSVSINPQEYEVSNIDVPVERARTVKESNDFFLLFDFSAKWDPVPTMLTQCHERLIKGFMGQTTAFRKAYVKPSVIVLGDNAAFDEDRYIHGNFGNGFWTFLGGHDPEDYRHIVGDPPTELDMYPNSPGYRLILNNILFPAAKKKEQKT